MATDPTPEELAQQQADEEAAKASAEAQALAKEQAKAKKALQKDADSVKQTVHRDENTGTVTTVFG